MKLFPSTIGSPLAEYQGFLAGMIRKSEISRARGDKERLGEIEACTDDYLLKRWLWTFAIVGGPITFIAIPVLLSGVGSVLPHTMMNYLWTMSKGAMAIIFVMFLVAVFTSNAKQ
jgi:hypothetical protein